VLVLAAAGVAALGAVIGFAFKYFADMSKDRPVEVTASNGKTCVTFKAGPEAKDKLPSSSSDS
jgi:hypothetical protein